jgi:TP901 family phage tail tape measure protein
MKSSGEDINTVYDVLFATLNKGNAKFQDIAQYLPKIIPGAKQAGFALTETAGAWAYLTAQGQSAEQSTTGLMNAFKALSNPEIIYGGKTKGGFKSLGVDIFDATGKMKPLISVVTDLSKVMSGLTDEKRIKKFASIGLDMEAAGAFASMTQNVEELRNTIEFTTNSTGQLNEAVKNSRTSTEGWKEGVNKVKVLMIQFGQNFLPIVREIGEGFNWVMEKIMGGIEMIKQFYNESVLLQDIVKVLAFTTTLPFKILGDLFSFIVDAVKWIDSKLGISSTIVRFFQDLEMMWIGLKATASGVMNIFTELWKVIVPIGDALANLANPTKLASSVAEVREAFTNMDLKGAFNKGFNESMKESFSIKNKVTETTASIEGLKPQSTAAQGIASAPVAEGEDSVRVGGANPHKIININLEALHKGDNILKQEGASGEGISLDELEKKMNEIFLRLLRNANTAF